MPKSTEGLRSYPLGTLTSSLPRFHGCWWQKWDSWVRQRASFSQDSVNYTAARVLLLPQFLWGRLRRAWLGTSHTDKEPQTQGKRILYTGQQANLCNVCLSKYIRDIARKCIRNATCATTITAQAATVPHTESCKILTGLSAHVLFVLQTILSRAPQFIPHCSKLSNSFLLHLETFHFLKELHMPRSQLFSVPASTALLVPASPPGPTASSLL